MTGDRPGKIAVLGGGSWATALAKLLLQTRESIVWYMRRRDRIDDFVRLGHNPVYLSDIAFDPRRIAFTDDINLACAEADTLLFVTPSPYFLGHADKISTDISGKRIVSAIKGMVPGENVTVSEYMVRRFGCDPRRILAIGGPCHAEEVALGRPSYLTVAGTDTSLAEAFAGVLRGPALHATVTPDILGVELAAVLKNVYAIAAGIIHGLKIGDNFLAVMVSNATREMAQCLEVLAPAPRDIDRSAYLGDLLVTCYSRFSRNHNFGSLIGRGYSVKAARMEMEQTAEGYYGTACIHDLAVGAGIALPLADAVHDIIYGGIPAAVAMRAVAALLE